MADNPDGKGGIMAGLGTTELEGSEGNKGVTRKK